MAAGTSILASGSAAGNSSTITLTDGQRATITLAGVTLPTDPLRARDPLAVLEIALSGGVWKQYRNVYAHDGPIVINANGDHRLRRLDTGAIFSAERS